MNHSHLPRALALLAGAAVVATVAVFASGDRPDKAEAAALPAPPTQFALVHAERFEVSRPFAYTWRADRPLVDEGWLLVLEGGADVFRPIQGLEPVIYVGAQTAARVNTGKSGRMVVVVPGDFDLRDTPIFLGAPALPEALDQPRIEQALRAAVAAGAVPPSAKAIADATKAGVASHPTNFELWLRAIDLVEQHSPDERDLIRGWRAPRIK